MIKLLKKREIRLTDKNKNCIKYRMQRVNNHSMLSYLIGINIGIYLGWKC